MSFLARKSRDDFNDVFEIVDNNIHRLESKGASKLFGGQSRPTFSVKDPTSVGTKGCPIQSSTRKRKLYQCSKCHRRGHNKSTCSQQSGGHASKCIETHKLSSNSDQMVRVNENQFLILFSFYIS